MQFRGPAEKGWNATCLSLSKRASWSGSQRSGTKVSGSAKLAGLWEMAQLETPTRVWWGG
jgi:hypothetical protein